jgi:hypothetical protein
MRARHSVRAEGKAQVTLRVEVNRKHRLAHRGQAPAYSRAYGGFPDAAFLIGYSDYFCHMSLYRPSFVLN